MVLNEHTSWISIVRVTVEYLCTILAEKDNLYGMFRTRLLLITMNPYEPRGISRLIPCLWSNPIAFNLR